MGSETKENAAPESGEQSKKAAKKQAKELAKAAKVSTNVSKKTYFHEIKFLFFF